MIDEIMELKLVRVEYDYDMVNLEEEISECQQLASTLQVITEQQGETLNHIEDFINETKEDTIIGYECVNECADDSNSSMYLLIGLLPIAIFFDIPSMFIGTISALSIWYYMK